MVENNKEKDIFKTESCWSEAHGALLCLNTGDWRTERPVVDQDRCNVCGICVIYCPPQCMVEKGDFYEADLNYCKGCGICAKECPKKAINMVSEGEYADECFI